MGTQKYLKLADRFKVNRHLVKEVFVDENLLKINGQNYWLLWVAYEPNIRSCLMLHISKDRAMSVYVIINSLSNLVNTKGNLSTYGRCSLIQHCI
jgi:hypothetical protein